jgi:mono/diheme cytochrome c family protein
MPKLVRASVGACTVLLVATSVVFVARAISAQPQKSAEDVYLDKCSVCHGRDGAAKTAKGKKVKAKDVRDTIKTMSEDEMFKIVENGKGKDMDSYKKELSKDQIKELVEFYRSLATK